MHARDLPSTLSSRPPCWLEPPSPPRCRPTGTAVGVSVAVVMLLLGAVQWREDQRVATSWWAQTAGVRKPMQVVPVTAQLGSEALLPLGPWEKQGMQPLPGLPLPMAADGTKVIDAMELLPKAEEIDSSLADRAQRFWKGVALATPFLITLFGVKRHLDDKDRQSSNALLGDNAESSSSRRWLMGLAVLCSVCMFPAVSYAASAVSSTASLPAITLETLLGAGFVQAFSLIFLSEVGDKTFFIAGLLAVKYGKLVSYCGSMAALIAMSVVAVLLGQVFHAVPPSLTSGLALDDYAATILFAYFGVQAIREAASMPADRAKGKMDEDLVEAEEVVEDFEKKVSASNFWPLFLSTCSLVFAAEFGDKSFLATIGLSAAQNPVSVTAGAVAGHGLATAIAVISGAIVSKFLSERVMAYISGGFFLTFAATTLLGLLGIHLPLPF